MMKNKDRTRAKRVAKAMLTMTKLDVVQLRKAFDRLA